MEATSQCTNITDGVKDEIEGEVPARIITNPQLINQIIMEITSV
jgi:hypothetical protein